MRARISVFSTLLPSDVERLKVALLRHHNVIVDSCREDTNVRTAPGKSQAICLLEDVPRSVSSNPHLLKKLVEDIGKQIVDILGVQNAIVRENQKAAPALA